MEGLVDLNLDVPKYGWTDRAALIELGGYGSYPVSWKITDEQETINYSVPFRTTAVIFRSIPLESTR